MMRKSGKEEKQPEKRPLADADEKIWRELKLKTADRAKSLEITSEADIERIIHEVRGQNFKETNSD